MLKCSSAMLLHFPSSADGCSRSVERTGTMRMQMSPVTQDSESRTAGVKCRNHSSEQGRTMQSQRWLQAQVVDFDDVNGSVYVCRVDANAV